MEQQILDMILSDVRGGHMYHSRDYSEMNLSTIVDDFGNALCSTVLTNRAFLMRFAFINEARYA